MKRLSNVLAWVLTVFLAFAFIMAGGVKLVSSPAMVHEFAQIGLGQWLRYVTGVLEVSGAIGLVIPKVRSLAALQLACVMVGATLTNIAVLRLPSTAMLTATLLALILALAWLHRPGQTAPTSTGKFRASA